MGVNDAREQLEVCKQECLKLERKHEALRSAFRSTLASAGFHDEMIERILHDYEV